MARATGKGPDHAPIEAWVRRRPGPGTFLPICYAVGVRSVLVVCVTGMFIGMVLAVQAYGAYRPMGLETWMGSLIHTSVIKELGPVLAATMLAGRVGSAMAAELGTMRVTEQIDALATLGVDPVHYLVVPRFLACVLLIPLLTIMADGMGIVGGALICLNIYGIDPHHYWQHGRDFRADRLGHGDERDLVPLPARPRARGRDTPFEPPQVCLDHGARVHSPLPFVRYRSPTRPDRHSEPEGLRWPTSAPFALTVMTSGASAR